MKVVLTGVSGFIGSVTARHLYDTGHSVTGLVRTDSRRDHVERWVRRFVVGDQADPGCFDELLDGADAVVHNSLDWGLLRDPIDLAGHLRSNVEAAVLLLEAAAPRPFVFMSTIAAHHDMRPRWAGTIDEDHPLRPAGLYGAAKAAVEAHLWAAHHGRGQHTVALRPCGVYGIDPRLDRSIGHPIIEAVESGKNYTRTGGGKFVHVEDVASAVVASLDRSDAAGHAFNLADCYARWSDWATMTADLLGRTIEVDTTSSASSKNVFSKDDTRRILGVGLDRGHDGIRAHIEELIGVMRSIRG